MTYDETKKRLELTENDLTEMNRGKRIESPKFFHFSGVPAILFHQAEVIVFTASDGAKKIIKNTFGVEVK